MLAKSKLSRAPRSDRSSWARSRASRSARSRARSTRSSQSTAFGPKVAMAIAIVPSLGLGGSAQVERTDLGVVQDLTAAAGEPDPAVLQHHSLAGQPQAGPGVLLH